MYAQFISFCAEWGYWGMALAAFAAGSIVPIGSEIIFLLLCALGLNPWLLILSATAGNTLGGMTCYWIGMLGRREWIERWIGVSDKKLERANRFIEGRGAWMGFFAFVPYIGEAIIVLLGIMRSNQLKTAVSMTIGKALRYYVLYLIFKGVINI